MATQFEIVIADSPDRKKVFAEISVVDPKTGVPENVLDILDETDRPQIMIYSKRGDDAWCFDYQEFMETVASAKRHLVGE